MSSIRKNISYLILGIFFVSFLALQFLPSNKSENKEPESSATLKSDETKSAENSVLAIKSMIDSGLIEREDPALNEIHVNSGLWHSLNIDQKEKVARSMAYYCGFKKGNSSYWVEVYDYQTGRKIAKYSKAWGFKTF